ncbi:MAG TPA: acyltransferase family protein [Rhodanobacteraceae bacterium]|nr:acyltransferase family protein [Rhodanobacteraceae bacterium]
MEKCHPSTQGGRLKWLFGGIFIVSFALSLYWTHSSPLFAFYLMPSRAWQFALGAIVFLAVGSPAFRVHSALARSVWLRLSGWVGLAMILLAAWFIHRTTPYPGTWALLPTVGAALVLAAGANDATLGAGRVLSWRPMQALGRVSYSWYLWHWPILLLGATLLDTSNGWNRLLLVVVSLAIAAISYHLFETPIRHYRKLVAKPRWAVGAALAVMLVAELLLRGWQTDAQNLAKAPQLARFVAAKTDEAAIYAKGCFASYASTRVQICTFGDPNARHTMVLMGDSKAAHWFPAYRQIFDKPGWRILAVTKSACPMIDVSYVAPPLRREYTECAHWRRDALRTIAALRPDVVVLSEGIAYPFTRNQWISGTRHVLEALADNTRQIYLMRPTPKLPFNGRTCPEPRGRLYAALVSKSHCTSKANTLHFDDVGQWLKQAAAPFQNVRIVDMTDSLCPGGVCHSEIDGQLVFSDAGSHMTASFARGLAPALARALGSELWFPSPRLVKPLRNHCDSAVRLSLADAGPSIAASKSCARPYAYLTNLLDFSAPSEVHHYSMNAGAAADDARLMVLWMEYPPPPEPSSQKHDLLADVCHQEKCGQDQHRGECLFGQRTGIGNRPLLGNVATRAQETHRRQQDHQRPEDDQQQPCPLGAAQVQSHDGFSGDVRQRGQEQVEPLDQEAERHDGNG